MSFSCLWNQSFCKRLLYKQIVLKGFYSRYLLIFTTWQLLSFFLIIAPHFPTGTLPFLSCVQSLGLRECCLPLSQAVLSREPGHSNSLSGTLNLELKGSQGEKLGRINHRGILWEGNLVNSATWVQGASQDLAFSYWFFRYFFSSKSYSKRLAIISILFTLVIITFSAWNKHMKFRN